ncbi:MAG TPA: YggS family pyridoxal phosphate-dependent enzyme [Thermoguttaceae bacterium]
MSNLTAKIAENIALVHERIKAAVMRSGRQGEEIKLVAVTKYVGAEEIRLLIQAGCLDLGESRPQQLWQKAEELSDLPIRWHLVGHLQRNKVNRTLPFVSMIHSVDSLRLIKAIDEAAAKVSRRMMILLEVNTSGEPAKNGFQPDEVDLLLSELATFQHVEIRGLMCMASLEGGLDVARRDFAALRNLRDRLKVNCPPEIHLDELSMGMSGDYEVAIEEGATIVRVGTALFEGAVG